MRSWVSTLADNLRASLWPVPLASLLASVLLALVSVWVDRSTSSDILALIITDDAQAAREVLGVVATAMLTLTALVFTITIVVLQLAASQYSPRITRAFLRDRVTKATLALFLGTFAYSLLVLRAVRTLDGSFVPTLSVGITYLLVFASLVVFVTYLDHVAHSIRVGQIVRRLAREGAALYDSALRDADVPAGEAATGEPVPPVARVVHWTGSPGVLAYVDERGLAKQACELGGVVAMRCAIGDFVPHGAPVLDICGDDIDVDDRAVAACCACLSIGSDRTLQQDLGLPLRHLVDVALRALSPGINDPTTAVQALDYVHDLLRRLVRAGLPSAEVRDEHGDVRAIMRRASWESLVALTVTEIRVVAPTQVQVARRILHMLDDLLAIAPPDRCAPLRLQRHLWIDATRAHFDLPGDREAAHRADAQGLGASPH